MPVESITRKRLGVARMALIQCPECNKEVSSEATLCPNCGHILRRKSNIFKNKKVITLIAVIMLLCITSTIIVVHYLKNAETEKNQEYKNELNNVVTAMLNSASKAEDIINVYVNVWDDSIEAYKADVWLSGEYYSNIIQNFDSNVTAHPEIVEIHIIHKSLDKTYTKDFNEALVAMKYFFNGGDGTFFNKNYIAELDDNGENFSNILRDLKDTPKDLEQAYKTAFELYSLYEEYILLATSPSGSLSSYSEKAEQLSSKIVTKAKEFEVLMPQDNE